jgi:hypothetical protein
MSPPDPVVPPAPVLPAPPAPEPLDPLEVLEPDPVVHSGGSVVLPMHSSHVAQVLRHAFTGRQGWHFTGSLMSASVHEPFPAASSEPSQIYFPLPAGSSQQPKQSHPLGVSGPQ